MIVVIVVAAVAVGLRWAPGLGQLGAKIPASPVAHAQGGPRVAQQAAQPTPAPAALPTQLLVPAIGVNAAVERVGMDAAGRMATPSRADHVAWFEPGAAPGEAGNAVIDGHLDWTSGPAVFWRLNALEMGDRVTVVRADGSRIDFLVDAKTEYVFDAQPPGLFTRTGAPAVALVTCTGTWDQGNQTYQKRLVVHATIAPTPPSSTPGDEGG